MPEAITETKSLPKVVVKSTTTHYVECPHCKHSIDDFEFAIWFHKNEILTGINKSTGKIANCIFCSKDFLITGYSE